MEPQYLLPNEKLAITSGDYSIILTNQRIRQYSSDTNKAHLVSIFLKNISSIEVTYKSKPVYLIAGILMIITSFLSGQDALFIIGLLAGAFLIGAYFFSRKHLISIYAKGGASINLKTSGMTKYKVMDFVNNVEKEMQKYLCTETLSLH